MNASEIVVWEKSAWEKQDEGWKKSEKKAVFYLSCEVQHAIALSGREGEEVDVRIPEEMYNYVPFHIFAEVALFIRQEVLEGKQIIIVVPNLEAFLRGLHYATRQEVDPGDQDKRVSYDLLHRERWFDIWRERWRLGHVSDYVVFESLVWPKNVMDWHGALHTPSGKSLGPKENAEIMKSLGLPYYLPEAF